MKQKRFVLAIMFLLTLQIIQSQEVEDSSSKFNIIGFGGIGYGQVRHDKSPDYDLNSNMAEILLNYKFWDKYGLATGLGYTELSGSGFNASGNFYQDRLVLKIPVLFTLDAPIAKNININGNIGPYAQTLVKDEYQYMGGVEKDVYEGWNFGIQMEFGLSFSFDEHLSLGLMMNFQSDFSDLETKNSASFRDKQKIQNLSNVGLLFIVIP